MAKLQQSLYNKKKFPQIWVETTGGRCSQPKGISYGCIHALIKPYRMALYIFNQDDFSSESLEIRE